MEIINVGIVEFVMYCVWGGKCFIGGLDSFVCFLGVFYFVGVLVWCWCDVFVVVELVCLGMCGVDC